MKSFLKLKLIWLAAVAFLVVVATPALAQTASVEVKTSATPVVSENFFVQFLVNSPDAAVNTAHLEISFTTTTLQFQEASFTDSVMENIVERDSNTAGLVKLTSFTTDSFRGEGGLVATIKMTALANGDAEIRLQPETTIHLADGTGNNIYDGESVVLNFTVGSGTPGLPAAGFGTLDSGDVLARYFPEGGAVDYRAQAEAPASGQPISIPEKADKTDSTTLLLVFSILLITAGVLTVAFVISRMKKEKETNG